MLWKNSKNQQIEHEKTKIYTFQIFQFRIAFIILSYKQNILISLSTQKPQLCYCPDGLADG